MPRPNGDVSLQTSPAPRDKALTIMEIVLIKLTMGDYNYSKDDDDTN